VYLELPDVGTEVVMEEEVTEIESTKTTSPVLAPVSGTIIEVNEELRESPQLINEDPYGKGWIVILKMTNPDDLDSLMCAKEYEEHITEGADDEYLLRLIDPRAADPIAVAAALAREPWVAWAEPDFIREYPR